MHYIEVNYNILPHGGLNDPRPFHDVRNQLEPHVLKALLVQHPRIVRARFRPDDVTTYIHDDSLITEIYFF